MTTWPEHRCARHGLAWRRIAARLLLGASAAFGPSSPARAHPDIRIENRVSFIFEGPRVAGIEESWSFDPGYSAELLADYDADRDGHLSAAESQAIARHIVPNLAEERYFTYVWVDGRELGALLLRDFVATASGGRVTFSFIVDLPSPVDPRHQALKVEIDDRDYYAEFRLAEKDPVRLREPRGVACAPRVRDDVEHAYFGYVYPQEITLSCR
jgi:tRNA threonylcarbamoyladenosine biosynthesis protein TsaE